MLTLGFTLSYGAMFSKVWRVHRLTTKAKRDIKVIITFYDILFYLLRYAILLIIETSSTLEAIFDGIWTGLCRSCAFSRLATN